jgi:Tol biopolymer transport system component
MFASDTSKRKNEDKPKGLPRRRMQVLVALLIAAVILVSASLILRAALVPTGPTGHLYYRSYSQGREDGYVLDFATSERTHVDGPIPTPPILNFTPTSPDGIWTASWEVSNYEGKLVIASANPKPERRVLGTFHTGGTFMTWSPDSQWLVFSANTDPITQMPYPAANEELFRVNIETQETEQLTFNTYLDEWPSYSPDGSKIAYVAAHDGYRRLWVMDAVTKTSTLVVSDMYVYFPTWSPDSRWIAYMTDHADQAGDIWIVRDDGSELTSVVIGPDNAREPAWMP